jgi:GTPase SAR1 family protein
MKLMIVGPANVGKTALVRALSQKWKFLDGRKPLDESEKNVSTDGIDIGTYEFDSTSVEDKKKKLSLFQKSSKRSKVVTVSVWDFAGQEVYVLVSLLLVPFSILTVPIVHHSSIVPIKAIDLSGCIRSYRSKGRGISGVLASKFSGNFTDFVLFLR